jgi:hypothetical protein
MPTTRQASTRTPRGSLIQKGASCGCLSSAVGCGPKKVWWMNRIEYSTLSASAPVARKGNAQLKRHPPWFSSASARNISLDRKPFSSGTPAMAAAATIASVAVWGMLRNRPLSFLTSRVPVSWSMMPTAMNSDALKVAWLIVWKMAATAARGVPIPRSSTIKPRWLIVE